MGFELKMVISSPVSPGERGTIIAAALARWPFCRGPRDPEVYPDRVVFAPPELTGYLYRSGDKVERAISLNYQLKEQLPEWSRTFPAVTFAFIEADCFAGDCEYNGYCCRAGQVFQEGDGLVGLAAGVGIEITGAFAPLVRGFFAGPGSGGFD